jgi:hypothetical protein
MSVSLIFWGAFCDWILIVDDFIKAEEAPAALLLAQAALLSSKKQTWRKAALWYFIAANRLEKCGIVGPDFFTATSLLL